MRPFWRGGTAKDGDHVGRVLPGAVRVYKITVTPEGVARARRESMARKGVGASVTPELLKHAREQGELLRRRRRGG